LSLSVAMSVCLCLSVCLSVCLSLFLFVCLSVCLCLSLCVCLSTCVQVLFNLANQYAANDMDNEALNTYNVIIKTKDFNNSGNSLLSISISHASFVCLGCSGCQGFVV